MAKLNRRKFLTLSATSLGLFLTPKDVYSSSKEQITWEGIALGADCKMTLFHENKKYAKDSLELCKIEIIKLENIFSLFKPSSSISKLNKNGALKNPPKELIEVLNFANTISAQTNGAFDITVQSLWNAHSKYFNKEEKLEEEINKAKKLVSYKNIIFSKNKISFSKKNTQITLNAIAQGYITDKITDILKTRGFDNVLVNLGEFSSIGGHVQNRDWNIATPYLEDIPYLRLNNQSMASSGAYGTRFNKKYHHLFDVKTGTSANYVKSVTVKASRAMLADAISTAICVMPKEESRKLKNIYPNIEIYTS